MIRSVKRIRDSKDWRAHAWWLEKNVPEYARKEIKEGEDKITNNNAIIMDAKTTQALSEAYDRHMADIKKMQEANNNDNYDGNG